MRSPVRVGLNNHLSRMVVVQTAVLWDCPAVIRLFTGVLIFLITQDVAHWNHPCQNASQHCCLKRLSLSCRQRVKPRRQGIVFQPAKFAVINSQPFYTTRKFSKNVSHFCPGQLFNPPKLFHLHNAKRLLAFRAYLSVRLSCGRPCVSADRSHIAGWLSSDRLSGCGVDLLSYVLFTVVSIFLSHDVAPLALSTCLSTADI